MVKIMGILNLTPDSFWEPSRYDFGILDSGADIVDIGAVSTRPGASPVSLEEEWRRLKPVLARLDGRVRISIDTARSEIVRRAYEIIGPFIVNDVSSGEDDPEMLGTVAGLALPYVAMHHRGTPETMDSLCEYPCGVINGINDYFREFGHRAAAAGLSEWIVDPGLGFAKTTEQNMEVLERLDELRQPGRQLLVGAADKRFTGGDTERSHLLALKGGADILRVHDVEAARRTVESYFSKM